MTDLRATEDESPRERYARYVKRAADRRYTSYSNVAVVSVAMTLLVVALFLQTGAVFWWPVATTAYVLWWSVLLSSID